MSRYRDDVQALRIKKAELEQELNDTEQQLSTNAAQLDQQRAQLAAKEAKIDELRAKLAALQPPEPEPDGQKHCRSCGRTNQPHYKFCLGCGQALPDEVSPAVAPDRRPSPPAAPKKAGASSPATIIIVIVLLVLVLLGIGTVLALLGSLVGG